MILNDSNQKVKQGSKECNFANMLYFSLRIKLTAAV